MVGILVGTMCLWMWVCENTKVNCDSKTTENVQKEGEKAHKHKIHIIMCVIPNNTHSKTL